MRIIELNTNCIYKHNIQRGLCFKKSSPQDEVKVSVIVPIYNKAKFLPKALESLQKQTLKEVEFICVNDGSTDNSLDILKEYAKDDYRIKIVDQRNQSCGVARNNGIKIARGEYIAFLDPDDWFEPEALEELYNKSKKQNCDLMVFNFNSFDENGNFIKKFNLQKRLQRFYDMKEEQNFNWKDIKPRALGGLYPASWNKFYRRDLIKENNIRFARSNLAEDNVFVFAATLNAQNIGYVDKAYYNYLVNSASTIRSSSDKNLALFHSIDCVKNLLKKMNLIEELKNEFDGYILRFVSYHSKQIKSKNRFWELCKKKLTPDQYNALEERFKANSMLPEVITFLKNRVSRKV